MHAGQHRDNATSAASVFLFDENRHRQPPPGTRDRKRRPPCISRYNLQQRRGVAQSGSASALGAEGRGFESLRPDQHKLNYFYNLKTISSHGYRYGYHFATLLSYGSEPHQANRYARRQTL